MALLWTNSFDHYATADILEEWTTSGTGNSGTIAIAAGGRHSSNSMRFGTGGLSAFATFVTLKAISAVDATCIMGFSLTVPTGTVGSAGMGLSSIKDGSVQVTLRINSDGTLSVLRGASNGTNLGTSSLVVTFGTNVYIEWKVLIHPSAGTVEVRINGVVVLNLTGQNTRNTANSQWTSFTIGHADSVGNSVAVGSSKLIDYDDLYVCDGSGSAPWNTFLGDCRVDPCYPTAEGSTIQWTPLSGTDNSAMVDETAPDDDTTYNSASSTGLTDTFVVQDAPVVGATIYGIRHCISMKKTDAGVCTIALVIRHSGVDNVGSSLSPGTSYAYGTAINQTNPGTSAAWAESDFNAAEFGYKRVT